MDISLRTSRRHRLKGHKQTIPGFLFIFLGVFLFTLMLAINSHSIAYAQTVGSSTENTPEYESKVIDSTTLINKDRPLDGKLTVQTVTINYGGESYVTFTDRTIVREILEQVELEFSETDIITPTLDEHIASSGVITLIKVEEEIERESEPIPFSTVYVDDNRFFEGERKVIQPGQDGTLSTLYSLRYEDGELTDRVEIGTEVTNEPVDQIIAVGTKPPLPIVVDDRRCDYWYAEVDRITNDATERSWLKNLMWHESGCNASADNGVGNYGLLQFAPGTFTGYGGTDIWSGQQQINTALVIYRLGGCPYHWPARNCF